jgi:hypothetical protein
MRVFLDANILFSAAQPKSWTRAFLRVLLKRGEGRFVYAARRRTGAPRASAGLD